MRYAIFIFLLFFLVIGSTQYLNHTGFCYGEMRYLNEREIVDSFLFKGKEKTMNLEEKIVYVKENFDGADYPECCRYIEVLDNNHFSDPVDRILVGLLYNHPVLYLHKIDTIFPASVNYWEQKIITDESDKPYVNQSVALDSCGNIFRGIFSGNSITQESYEKKKFITNKYWIFKESGAPDTEYQKWLKKYRFKHSKDKKTW